MLVRIMMQPKFVQLLVVGVVVCSSFYGMVQYSFCYVVVFCDSCDT